MTGDAARLASLPISDAPRGGVDTGFNGAFGRSTPQAPIGEAAPQVQNYLIGPLLEADDETAYTTIHNLVLRQERLARNRLAQDAHWTRIRQGFWSRLEKVQDQDLWRAITPPGAERSAAAAVPNKAADLCSKFVETLMVDPPQPDPRALDLGEVAERGAEMAEQFLLYDGGDTGTADAEKFWNALDAATCRASGFLHLWVDTSGGGYTPLQIKAHPHATDPRRPDVAQDPVTGQFLPTADPILRYVSDDGQGNPVAFVENPADAGQSWIPKIRIDVLGREHVRTYPETLSVRDAEMVIVIWYCTLGDAKRRWPRVANLPPDQLAQLCDWTPQRFLVILPPSLRARWKLSTGAANDTPGGSNDERLMFYYLCYRRATPRTIGRYQGYPYGAMVAVSGAFGGFVLDRSNLTAEVEVPTNSGQQLTDRRCMEIPVVQITPRMDPDDRDPTGMATMSLFGGASEASQTLLTAYLQALDIILHPAKFIPSTSPIQGWQIEQSRGTGTPVPVVSRDDYPHYEEPRPLPPGLVETVAWNYSQMESASGLTKPALGANDQQEVSGIARNIAVRQAMVALSRAAQQTMNAWTRYWRIKLELAMKYFKAPQAIHYVGEDGAYKVEWFRGNDFAVIDRVSIQAGTGSMMPSAEKQQHIAFGQQMHWLTPDEAADAARPTFSDPIGLGESSHAQRIERQVSLWLKGPPSPEWIAQWQQYRQMKQQFDLAMQQFEQAQQQYQFAAQIAAIVEGGPPPPTIGPENQQAAAMQMYQRAVIESRVHPLPPMPPQPPQIPPPPEPWTPFQYTLPNDTEPEIAALRKRRLSRLMSTARFSAQPIEWQQPLYEEYVKMRQASAIGLPTAAAAQQLQQGGNPFGAAGGATAFQMGGTAQANSPGPGGVTSGPAQQLSPGRNGSQPQATA